MEVYENGLVRITSMLYLDLDLDLYSENEFSLSNEKNKKTEEAF